MTILCLQHFCIQDTRVVMHQVRNLIFDWGLSCVQQRCRNKQFIINEISDPEATAGLHVILKGCNDEITIGSYYIIRWNPSLQSKQSNQETGGCCSVVFYPSSVEAKYG
jgi:hypothetical protein